MMNFKNKILITMLFALGTILWSCDSLIYDDLADCPQGVYLKFYSMTPCETDSSFIGEVESLKIFAFDKNNKLVLTHNEGKVNLSRDFQVLMPVSDGDFTFIAWAGVNDNFTLGSFSPGTTTKEDVMLTLKLEGDKAAKLGATRVWEGESESVFLPTPDEWATVYKYTAINLREVTNRVKLTIIYDPQFTPVDLTNFNVGINSDNGVMNINGNIASGAPVISYPSYNESSTQSSMTWNFTLMDLVEGKTNNLKIIYKDTDETFFDGDLIKHIILNSEGSINLACENDFEIVMNLTDYCETCETHFTVAITINGWKVHSYETEL